MSVGLHIMRPTSIVVAGAGSSASIRSDGGVEFTSATSLSLNGVFTAAYDNYMIGIRSVSTTADVNIHGRYRTNGTDATGANYADQYLFATSTTLGAARATAQDKLRLSYSASTNRSGGVCYVYGPNLSQPTASRMVTVSDTASGAIIYDAACTHSLSTSYDGITMFPSSGSFTGMVTVYGMAQ